jgi:type IV pilus assembly protein PilY1
MRIPDKEPSTTDTTDAGYDANAVGFGRFELPDDDSFISDTITVDMQTQHDYMADTMYFGTISGDWSPTGWGGKMYRLVSREECNSEQRFSDPSEWDLMTLFDAGQAITTAPTVGTDSLDFWVYFGTGRFWDAQDKIDASSNATQTYYGIKEPVDPSTCELTWGQVWNNRIDSPAGGGPGADRGTLGLVDISQVGILSSATAFEPNTLYCKDGGTCLDDLIIQLTQGGVPPELTYQNLIDYIAGTNIYCAGGYIGHDGWYRDFADVRERNLGQASLLGGLLSFTTYKPYANPCLAEGSGYLYGLYYQTGTPYFEDIFGIVDVDNEQGPANPERVDLGRGLSTTPNIHVGKEEGGKAFIQTSVGQIREIPQPNLPGKHVKSGRIKWRDIEQQ